MNIVSGYPDSPFNIMKMAVPQDVPMKGVCQHTLET